MSRDPTHPESGETLIPDTPTAAPETAAPQTHGRYRDLGPLGTGGMGEVRRVHDPELNRVMAMKVLREELRSRPRSVARFISEAQTTAQLQHPGIVPVHELGIGPDGRPYFTMAEVRGRTLTAVISDAHHLRPPPGAWSRRQMVVAFLRVCEAVGYAHERGVVHRDLKPENVMVGEHGEVQVLDWGVAQTRGEAPRGAIRSTGGPGTRIGTVVGTPAYMAPEQARGERATPRSDIYALGATLYQILCGAPPYQGERVLRQVLAGPPPPPGSALSTMEGVVMNGNIEIVTPADIPGELTEICGRAMARDPDERHPDAGALADAVRGWLAGVRRREQALEVVGDALRHVPAAARLRERSRALAARGHAALATLEGWRSADEKAQAWACEDEAADLLQRAALEEETAEQALQAALRIDPELPEAHAALAERYRRAHADAETARDVLEQRRAESRLRQHVSALPEDHPERRESLAYLDGTGALTLHTVPDAAEVTIQRYSVAGRRLVPGPVRRLGRTPLRATRMEMGSYLCWIERSGAPPLPYPVVIGRQEHWDGRPRDADAPTPIRLDVHGDCIVSAGWFQSAGDPAVAAPAPRRYWVEAFSIQRFQVTNAQYLLFLDDLVAQGRAAEALAAAPRERPSGAGRQGELCYGRSADGRFFLQADADGDVWSPDWPVCMVDHHGATAYARWLSERTGLPWRLPDELEWEKAARGVDGRLFPWGDHIDPSWACMQGSHQDRPLPAPVEAFPVDESPYGVRGMAGNMRDWTASRYDADGPITIDGWKTAVGAPVDPGAYRVCRGGGWMLQGRAARAAGRIGDPPASRNAVLSFRLARSLQVGT